MAYDSLTLSVLIKELANALTGGRITKISQPERDEIVFTVFRGGALRLAMSVNPGVNRLHLTDYTKENPQTPPNFCMLLRKHLTNAAVAEITQMPFERVCDFTLQSKNELGYAETKHLLFELTGKTANLILTDETYVVIDTLKRLPHDLDAVRVILAGAKYEFFTDRGKIRPDDGERITALITQSGQAIDKLLTENLLGVSTSTVREMLCGIDLGDHSDENASRAATGVKNYLKKLSEPNPNIAFDGETPLEAYPFDYASVKAKKVFYPTLNKAHDEYYFLKNQTSLSRQKSKNLHSALKNAVSRLEKKIAVQTQSLLESADSEKYKKYGDLILSNIYAIKPGAEKLVAADYFEENSPQIEIPLDAFATPQKNAQEYFKKYRKLKNTTIHLDKLLDENKARLDYVKGVQENLKFSVTDADLMEITDELVRAGITKTKVAPVKKPAAPAPVRYEIEGFGVLVGKTNVQNEFLTKNAKPYDLWLHTNSTHSAHVIVETEQKPLPDGVIVTAAEITAFYSAARGGGKTAVDYTLRKNIKKPPESNLGYVIYNTYNTVVVIPNEHKELLKK